jgi:hypothetical protein
VEQWVFSKSLHLRRCGTTCTAETYKLLADEYFKKSTDVQGPTMFNGCQEWDRTTGNVKQVWVNSATGAVCKAVVNGASGQRTLVFSNYVANAATVTSKLSEWSGWSCPAPTCNRVMDVVLVLDESGSISSSEWKLLIAFSKSVVESYRIASDATNIGVVFFQSSARIISYLSDNKESILKALETGQKTGNTCIGCGMSVAYDYVFNNIPASKKVAGRPANPAQLMITLTDGENNTPSGAVTNLTNSANKTKNAGVVSVAIGVKGYRYSDLAIVASNLATGKAIYTVDDWNKLKDILSGLIMETCSDLPTQPCGLQCYGFCSCNQQCVCPVCRNLGRCYTNNCTSPATGCVAKQLTCSTTNKCVDMWCDNEKGCQSSNKNCTDSDPCTLDTCQPGSGCLHDRNPCDDNNKCTNDTCDSAVGCSHTYTCDDNNNCTVDTCDPAVGCGHTARVCDDGNECTENRCDPVTGCYFPIKNCDDHLVCTEDWCDNTTGCLHTARDCEDGDICTDNPCVEPAGCQNVTIPCDACKQFYEAGHTCDAGPCESARCVQIGNSTAECEHTAWTDEGQKCDTGNKCIQGGCNTTTNECTRTAVECVEILCTDVECNPLTGECERTLHVCDDGDPCTVDYCDNATGACRTTPFCNKVPCKTPTCVVGSDGTNATCEYVDYDCDSGNECSIDVCDDTMDKCQHFDVTCQSDKICVEVECDPAVGCVETNLTCDDQNPCTNDFCNETIGCYHTPKCVDDLFCTLDLCLPDGTCSHPSINCTKLLVFKDGERQCFDPACNEVRHCHKETKPAAVLDVCGNCLDTFANASLLNDTYARTACVGSLTWPKFAATLTAAAIAGIIIAALIGAIIVALSGFFGTRELLRRAKLAQDQAAHTNPLYEAGSHELVNPTYKGDS